MRCFSPKVFLLLPALVLFACQSSAPKFETSLTSTKALQAHSEEFEKQIIKVTEGIYVAIGYGLANSIMIEGDDGLIIVDVLESIQTAEVVKSEFDKITNKPIKAIIYTHNHTDHIFGARVFADGQDPEVYAQELMPYYLDRIATVIRPVIEHRSYRMFGLNLDQDALVNCGIGSRLNFDKNTKLGVIRPTITFKDSLETTIAGVAIKLFHAPGETNDQLFVWLPDKKVLLCGDNFYKTFPNLYTIRGTAYRDVNLWKQSLDKMRYLEPEFLIPSHTQPIEGKDQIYKVLTDYRDAIQYVHDQTVRGMNSGLTPDELVEKVKLPSHLAQSDYLQEFYGNVPWSVRAVFNGYLGHFDGNPSTLLPLSETARAKKIAHLAGGKEALIDAISKSFDNGEYQWCLELTDYLLQLNPENEEALQVRYDALIKLGEGQGNPNARHYYLTSALELKGLKHETLVTPAVDMVHNIPMSAIFNGLATRLDPEKSLEEDKVVVFKFPDSGEIYSVHIRKGVAEVQPFELPNSTIEVSVKSTVWKEIAAKLRTPLDAFLDGEIEITGGKVALINFFRLFDRE